MVSHPIDVNDAAPSQELQHRVALLVDPMALALIMLIGKDKHAHFTDLVKNYPQVAGVHQSHDVISRKLDQLENGGLVDSYRGLYELNHQGTEALNLLRAIAWKFLEFDERVARLP